MDVTIADPATPEENLAITFKLEAEFNCNPEDYGNGYYVYIGGKSFSELCYDLRYSTEFNRNRKTEWLKAWAKTYWSGENGAYAVESIDIWQE